MKFGILAGAVLIWAGTLAEASPGLGFSILPENAGAPGEVRIWVRDEATEALIPDASIELTESLGQAGSTASTDEFGFARVDARAPKILTVSHPGYTKISIAGVNAVDTPTVLVELKRMQPPRTVLASGVMTGWPSYRGSDVKAGLVFRALNPASLLEFNIDSIISPLLDTIDAMGKREIPSNFVLPKQTVRVGLIPVKLNKPGYRLPVRTGEPFHLSGIQVEIGAMDLVGAGNRPLKLLNRASFKRVGVTEAINPTADFQKNVDASQALSAAYTVTPSRPPFTSNVIVVAINDLEGDREAMLFSDVKLSVDSEKPAEVKPVKLMTARNLGKSHEIVTLAMTDDSLKLSGIITSDPTAQVRPGEFLPLSEGALSSGELVVTAPRNGVGLAQFHGTDGVSWMVYSLPGATARVPSQPGKHSLMQLDFGPAWNAREMDGSRILRQLARFSRVASALK